MSALYADVGADRQPVTRPGETAAGRKAQEELTAD